jgi:hypothetical protein
MAAEHNAFPSLIVQSARHEFQREMQHPAAGATSVARDRRISQYAEQAPLTHIAKRSTGGQGDGAGHAAQCASA